MTASPDRSRGTTADALDPLPPALSSMWRLCKLGYQHEPRLMLVAFGLSLLAALPDALTLHGDLGPTDALDNRSHSSPPGFAALGGFWL